uniref:Uncharacterized protein n=1 Tax=Kalanchoe fedtschenkoi TaxID=63787 RepID=A0A7N0SW64_KALFE
MSHNDAAEGQGRGAVSPPHEDRHSRHKQSSHDSDHGGRSGYRELRGRRSDRDRGQRYHNDRNSRDDREREKFNDHRGHNRSDRHRDFDLDRDRRERHRSPPRSKETSRNSSRSPSRGKRTSGFDMAPPGAAPMSGPSVPGNVGLHVPPCCQDLMFKGIPMHRLAGSCPMFLCDR